MRLRAYVIDNIEKGKGMRATDMLDDQVFPVEDHAASRRVEPNEVVIAHLLPAGDLYYIGGAAAHLTARKKAAWRQPSLAELAAYFAALGATTTMPVATT